MMEFRKPESYIRGLISVSALSRGLDVPDVSVVIMCRPLRSSIAEFLQIIGRGLRPYPGKPICTILDHSGNVMRFSSQMEEFFENGIHELDDGEKKDKPKIDPKEKAPVKCPLCFLVHKPAPICPECGYQYPAKQAIQHEAGELVEIGGAAVRNTSDKRQLFAELRGIQEARGWSDGRTSNVFREITGVWPNAYKYEPPCEPSPATLNRVRALAVAYAKKMKGKA
jgi:superfamily II DNA or RNA helicase